MTAHALQAGTVAGSHRHARFSLGAPAFFVASVVAATFQFGDRAEALTDLDSARGIIRPLPIAAPSFSYVADRSAPISIEEIDAFRNQIARCWIIPNGWTNPNQVSVAIRFKLNRDGTVNGTPVVEVYPVGLWGAAAAATAVRAVLQCGPYKLPADKYDQWRDVKMTFRPQ